MSDEYTEISTESLERLWPEPETRPAKAWTHSSCMLVVTNRAVHDEQGNPYRCPEARS